MIEKSNIDILDYLIVLIKWKRFILIFMIASMISTYVLIRFAIDEQFDSAALIIPSEDNSMGGLAGLLSGFDPFSMGLGGSASPELGRYNTIIFSRTSLEQLIKKFDIYKVYDIDTSGVEYKQLTLEMLSDNIKTEITDEGAYSVKVRSIDPELSANMANYIIKMLNDRTVELRVKKSKLNREFLGKRVSEVRETLKNAEDSLKVFQEESGILSADDQLRSILSVYSNLEIELISKQTELKIMEQVLSKESPEVEKMSIQVEALREEYNKLKEEGNKDGLLVSADDLPEKGLTYLRLLREIEISQSILQFVLPLFEQAKFEEQKDTPILQVIDYAEAPPKKSYPPRVLATLAINFGVFIFLTFYIFLKENKNLKGSDKLTFIRKNLFNLKSVEYLPKNSSSGS